MFRPKPGLPAGNGRFKSRIHEAGFRLRPDSGRGEKALERMRDVRRLKHYRCSTEQTYRDWAERFIGFRGLHHPREMGAEVAQFLTHLAQEGQVAA